jgi:archaellum component FlaF (FlaF/FlaG flagellin family)
VRLILTWLDQLRRTTVQGLPAFCSAIVSQFEDLAAAANTWAAKDHNSDGTHLVVRVGGTTSAPDATVGQITIYADGSDLKVVKPDGTIGTITVV